MHLTIKYKIFLLILLIDFHSAFSQSSSTENHEKAVQLQAVDVMKPVEWKKILAIQPTVFLDKSFISQNHKGSLAESLSLIPGISHLGIGSSQATPIIRGLGLHRVLVVENGIKHQSQQWGMDHGLEIDQFSVGEIQIVKGPASYAYGSDGIGGLIVLKPIWEGMVKQPDGTSLDIYMRFKSNNKSYGSTLSYYHKKNHFYQNIYFNYSNYADYQVPADTVQVYGYPVSLNKKQVRNTAGNELSLKLATGYLSSQFESQQTFSFYTQKAGFFANAHGQLPVKVNTEIFDRSDRDVLNPHQAVEHYKFISHNTWRIPENELSLDLGLQFNDREEFNTYNPHGYMPVHLPDDFVRADLERKYSKWIASGNFLYVKNISNHFLKFGLNAEFQQNKIAGWSFLMPAFEQLSGGVFMQNTYQLNPHTKVTGSLRYDIANLHIHEYADWFTSYETFVNVSENKEPVHVIRAKDLKKEFSSWSGALGLYHQIGNWNFKVHAGRSFRLPIAKELGANGVNYHTFSYEVGNPELKPEIAYQGDIGLYYANKNWSIELTPFYNYFSNFIYLNPTSQIDYLYGAGNQVFLYVERRVQQMGTEAVLKWAILPEFEMETQFEAVRSRQLNGDKKNFTLPFSPPIQWNTKFTYTLKKPNPIYFSAHFQGSARQNQIVPPESLTPGYHLIHLSAGLDYLRFSTPFSLNIQINNLFNTAYFNHTSFYRLINMPEKGFNMSISLSTKIFKS